MLIACTVIGQYITLEWTELILSRARNERQRAREWVGFQWQHDLKIESKRRKKERRRRRKGAMVDYKIEQKIGMACADLWQFEFWANYEERKCVCERENNVKG